MTTPHVPRPLLHPLFLACLILLANLLYPATSSGAAGTVIAWGDNTSGQTNVPPDLTNAVAVAAGASQSLAIRLDGTVSAWGGSSAALTNLPSGLSNVVQVAGGGTHSLALRADGTAVGWGDNFYPTTNSPTGQATPPASLPYATAIAAGWAHSVALRYDRTMIAWGYNGSRQTNVPANLGPAMAVAAGDWFSAALRIDGTVAVWGTNNVGQTNVPAGLSNVVAIAARGSTMLALKQNGSVVAWGGGSLGQTNVPADLTNAVAIAAGSGFELALRDDGRVTAWGDNAAGQTNGAAGLAQIVGLAAGGAQGVALLGDGSPRLTLQPRNQSAWAGSNVTFAAKAVGDPPLSYQWLKDSISLTETTICAGTATPTLTLTNISATNAGGYSLVISNASGSVTSAVATLTILNPALPDSLNPGASSIVFALSPQADGRVIVAGAFFSLGGQVRYCIGGLNGDGTVDSAFNPGAPPQVFALAAQADGKILVGGYIGALAGQGRKYIGRLNPDATLDVAFNPGATGPVESLVVQPDGKIVVVGSFSTLGGQPRKYIGRLNADGSVDTTLNPAPNAPVWTVALQADGKIVVGGAFNTLGGQPRSCIGRLNADGSVDMSFNPGAAYDVNSLAVQADGKILVGGRWGLGRLNSNGTWDTRFNNDGPANRVWSMAIQADGKILLGGEFTVLGGRTRNHIGRLNSDGTLDTTFDPGANGTVYSVGLQADGKILVGGSFTTLGGQSRTNIARLNNTEPPTESLTLVGSTVTWLRGGTGPGFWRTAFDVSTNGTDWASLGAGSPIAGGWQLTGAAIPTGATLRARGYVTGGYDNDSSWYLETALGPAAISQQPASRTNNADTIAQLVSVGAGTPPLSYQWCKGGVPLIDASNLSGAQTTTLTLTNVLGGDAGGYSVIISNTSGSVTSLVATLTVVDPAITTQPGSRTNSAGANVLFSAAVAGTTPLGYQWRRNGLSLSDTTGTSLSLTNVQWADAGGYDLVVSNCYGMVTSALAALTVNGPAIVVNNGNFGLGPNGFRFDVGCMPGQTVVIQASTNLVNWLPVQTDLVTSAGIVGFTDGDTVTVPQRFYRAVLLP